MAILWLNCVHLSFHQLVGGGAEEGGKRGGRIGEVEWRGKRYKIKAHCGNIEAPQKKDR